MGESQEMEGSATVWLKPDEWFNAGLVEFLVCRRDHSFGGRKSRGTGMCSRLSVWHWWQDELDKGKEGCQSGGKYSGT